MFYTGEENYLDYGKIDTWNGLRYGAALSPGQLAAHRSSRRFSKGSSLLAAINPFAFVWLLT